MPNSFFDQVTPNETLAVSKVVGSVIRHTVSYQNQFGGRRKVAPLSCTYIQNFAAILKRKAVVDGIRLAETKGYIRKVESGCFSPKSSEQSTSTYANRWLDQADAENIGSKREPAKKGFKKGTCIGSKKSPDNRFKKGTSKEKKKTKETLKQQTAAESKPAVALLTNIGFDLSTAQELSRDFPFEQISNQIKWLAERKPRQNELGMLRLAIEQNWEEPVHLKKERQSRERHRIQESEFAVEEDHVQRQKQARRQRRERLEQVWDALSGEQRNSLKEKAIKNEASLVKREILVRKNCKNPPTEFLDALAEERGLPRVNLASPQT